MKKLFSSTSLLLFTFLAIFSIAPKSILADGMMIKPNPYSDRWDYSNESNQQAFINYDNGLQKMIISVGLEDENSNGVVWLFPIPADPNKVAIDVVKNLPRLSGEEISKKAKSNLNNTTKFLQTTQIYTIPFIMLSRKYMGTLGTEGINLPMRMKGRDIEQDVVVYEHLEKEGITSEIITAKTAVGLYDYLNNKGLKIESGSIPVLDNYIGKEYSFVASWITSPEKILSTQNKGAFVTFPTKDIYYPMLPTSVYGSKIVPATIRVIGHVSPKVFQDIKSYTKTEYYIDNYASFADDLKNFYSGQDQNIKYTKIEINAPSKFLTNDLWISNSAPIKTYYSIFFAKHPVISAILLLIISSLITGVLVGWIIFKALRKNIFKLGIIGLSNCLSIFGLLITTILINTKEKDRSIEPVLTEIKQKGYIWKRRVSAILFFIVIPFLVSGFFMLLSLIREFSYSMRYFDFDDFIILFRQSLIIYILVIAVALIVNFIIKRIKPEDKNLFEQLKLNNYSLWSFQPKDKSKIIFVPLFSISFLIISWLLVKLIGFAV